MSRPALISALVTATVISAGWAVTSRGAPAPSAPSTVPAQMRAEGDVVTCSGGRQKSVQTRSSDRLFQTYVGDDPIIVRGTTVRVTGPSRGKDTVIVTFSAEARLINAFDVDGDYLAIEALVDGESIGPDHEEDGETAFAGSTSSYHMHSAQFCTRIGPGRHTVAMRAGVVLEQQAPVTGVLDDYLIRVDVHD